jgi:hypothetical protein
MAHIIQVRGVFLGPDEEWLDLGGGPIGVLDVLGKTGGKTGRVGINALHAGEGAEIRIEGTVFLVEDEDVFDIFLQESDQLLLVESGFFILRDFVRGDLVVTRGRQGLDNGFGLGRGI